MDIALEHIRPPVPSRSFDWLAYLRGREEDGPQGYGHTPGKTIATLTDSIRIGEGRK